MRIVVGFVRVLPESVRWIAAGLLGMLLVTVFTACTDKDKVPSGIISRAEMEKVLWDMVEADQYSSLYLRRDSARIDVKIETLKLYQEVFKLHQISREDFRKSFQYYQEHPELTRNVFDSILVRGNRLRTESYSRPSLNTSRPAVTAPAASAPVFSKPPPIVGRPPFRPAVTAPKPVFPMQKDPGADRRKIPDTARGKQPK